MKSSSRNRNIIVVNPKHLIRSKITPKKLICLVVALFVVGMVLYQATENSERQNVNLLKIEAILNSETVDVTNLHSACIIPQTPVMPEYFLKQWESQIKEVGKTYDCSYEKKLFNNFNDDQAPQLELRSEFFDDECCMLEITAGRKDSSPNLSDCTPIGEVTPLGDREAIAVKCGKGHNLKINVDTGIPIQNKPAVQKKINYWENVPESDRPINVLFFGLDSVSRMHAYRSIPRSIKLMKEIGFLDFNSYHSVAPSTLTNFMSFLMGMMRQNVRNTCAPTWTTPFDKCPLIWRDFSEKNYVTTYNEDGDQSFNWGGQGGFTEQPTDYSLHTVFKGLEKLREGQMKKLHLGKQKKKNLDCTSSERVPQYLLRYTQRFIKKFSNLNIPFFTFSWITHPFHEDIYSLSLMDDALVNFIHSIKENTKLLEKTMIIFVSDHGDRTSFFNSKSFESFIERGLPPLFIRLPEALTKKYPEMTQALQFNSRLLTTPYDIHHTLLHVLSLSSGSSNSQTHSSNTFEATLKDRSSLLVRMNPNRTCSDTNVLATRCLCNIQYSRDEKENDFRMDKQTKQEIFEFALSQLNLKIQSSKYKDDCEVWKGNVDKDLESARKLIKRSDYVTVLLSFSVYPEKAKFEATVKILLEGNPDFVPNAIEHDENLEFIGLSRISEYKNQSWCVGTETDFDKKLKEFCYCKAQPKHNTMVEGT